MKFIKLTLCSSLPTLINVAQITNVREYDTYTAINFGAEFVKVKESAGQILELIEETTLSPKPLKNY